jgi:hypothetical protein
MLKVKAGEKRTPQDLRIDLIAPCGMNCGLCMCYLREKNTCEGCRSCDKGKSKSVLSCTIRKCEMVPASNLRFCLDCAKLPCPRLKRLDARYREKYRMSMLENLHAIRENGTEKFVESERARWRCSECGGVQCVHTAECIYCGYVWTTTILAG